MSIQNESYICILNILNKQTFVLFLLFNFVLRRYYSPTQLKKFFIEKVCLINQVDSILNWIFCSLPSDDTSYVHFISHFTTCALLYIPFQVLSEVYYTLNLSHVEVLMVICLTYSCQVRLLSRYIKSQETM